MNDKKSPSFKKTRVCKIEDKTIFLSCSQKHNRHLFVGNAINSYLLLLLPMNDHQLESKKIIYFSRTNFRAIVYLPPLNENPQCDVLTEWQGGVRAVKKIVRLPQ